MAIHKLKIQSELHTKIAESALFTFRVEQKTKQNNKYSLRRPHNTQLQPQPQIPQKRGWQMRTEKIDDK